MLTLHNFLMFLITTTDISIFLYLLIGSIFTALFYLCYSLEKLTSSFIQAIATKFFRYNIEQRLQLLLALTFIVLTLLYRSLISYSREEGQKVNLSTLALLDINYLVVTISMVVSSIVILGINNYSIDYRQDYARTFIIYIFTISSFLFFNSFLCTFLLLELLTFGCLTFLSLRLQNKRAFFVYTLVSTISSISFILAIITELSFSCNLSQLFIFLFISLKVGLPPIGL